MEHPLKFLFATCQVGAERAVKDELARDYPDFRFAYSRPGFLTFKLPEGAAIKDKFRLHSVFARAYGFTLGKAEGASVGERVRSVIALAGERRFQRLHVWQRDTAAPGERGFEPWLTPLSEEIAQAIRSAWPDDDARAAHIANLAPARPGQLVLDCVIVEPDEWWVGFHHASSVPSRWPGGMKQLPLPADAVARTYLKMEEALIWSQLPLTSGDLVAEIGCSPGGASQALLSRGARVIGIDPAEVDPVVLAHPDFTHLRKRGADVRRREFRKVRWLTVDINQPPGYALDAAEAIVTNREVHIRGLLLNLKLSDWNLALQVPEYLARIRSWGFADVRARQLQRSGQEVCVAALVQERLRRKGNPASRPRRVKTTPPASPSD